MNKGKEYIWIFLVFNISKNVQTEYHVNYLATQNKPSELTCESDNRNKKW